MNAGAIGHVVGLGAIIAVSALAVGCAHDAVAPQTPVTETPPTPSPQTTSSTTTTSGTVPASSNVAVSADLLKACSINLNNEEKSPKFEFDESVLRGDDRSVLDQIARCVTTGPLQGRALHLIGRADPRGEAEYNMALGSSRASSVGTYLGSLGVPATQLMQTSRGKLDATGTDEAGWQLDRRVDVE